MGQPHGLRPTFSIVIPTYNRAKLVERAIRSVYRQGREDIEVVVVDDGSDDGTERVIASLDVGPLQFLRQDRAGATAARNRGAAAAQGTYLVFLDSDDELESGWGNSFGAAVAPAVGLVSCDCWRQDADGQRLRGGAWDLGYVVAGCQALLQSGTYAVDRAAFRAIGGFDARLVSGHHTDLAFRLLPQLDADDRSVIHIDRPMVVHHLGAPHSIRRNDSVVLEGTEQLIERHTGLLRRNPTVLADYHGVAGVSAARLGDTRRARRHLAEAARHAPGDPKRWARLLVSCVPGGSRMWQRGTGP